MSKLQLQVSHAPRLKSTADMDEFIQQSHDCLIEVDKKRGALRVKLIQALKLAFIGWSPRGVEETQRNKTLIKFVDKINSSLLTDGRGTLWKYLNDLESVCQSVYQKVQTPLLAKLEMEGVLNGLESAQDITKVELVGGLSQAIQDDNKNYIELALFPGQF